MNVNLNRGLDIGLSVIGGIIIALTLTMVILVLTADNASLFDEPTSTTATTSVLD